MRHQRRAGSQPRNETACGSKEFDPPSADVCCLPLVGLEWGMIAHGEKIRMAATSALTFMTFS